MSTDSRTSSLPESKRARTEEPDPDLGEEYNEILVQLRNKSRDEKNKYLNSIPYATRLKAQQTLDKKIVDVEYVLKRAQVQLRQLKEKRNLFDYYDDGRDRRDPY
jgi:hypothetical protein